MIQVIKKSLRVAASLALAFAPVAAHAAPVLNLNSPGAEGVTVYPDSQDKTLYYIAPTVMLVAHDDQGVPQFSYMEESTFWSTKAIVQATMVPSFEAAAIATAEKNIKAGNPLAKFTSLPFIDSNVVFGDVLTDLVEKSDCDHKAGLVGDEQTCSFVLNSKGRDVMRSQFKQGLTITMQLEFTIDGVIQNADGSYSNQSNTYEMAGRLGGAELARYPQLFVDSKGHVIGVSGNDGDVDSDRVE